MDNVKYDPPQSGVGGFQKVRTTDQVDALAYALQGAKQCATATAAQAKEQTVGETLRGMREEHERQYRRYQDALLTLPEYVLRMPVSKFRQLISLL